jgi:hypothetical protein
MTVLATFFLAIIAGWIVREPRRAALTVILPYLAMVAVQTWGLANGYGINPPSTVTPFSGAISYYVVQVIFLLVAMAIAAELAVVRAHAAASVFAGPWLRTAVATAIGATGTLWVIVGSLADAKLVAHHSSSGGTPLVAILGIGLNVIGVVALGVAAIVARRRGSSAEPLDARQPAAMTPGSR